MGANSLRTLLLSQKAIFLRKASTGISRAEERSFKFQVSVLLSVCNEREFYAESTLFLELEYHGG